MQKPYRTGHTWASKRQVSRLKKIPQFFLNFKNIRSWDKPTLIKNFLLLTAAIFLFGSILFLGMFAWIARDLPDPNSLSLREVAQSTKIYDRTGEHLLYEISGDEKRTLVTIDQIPQHVLDATLTAEDRKFYDHSGIDIKGIIRSILVNVTTLNPTGQGASTITQQLVKNAILTNEQTYTRKVKEIVLALALERRYTKDEILQLYLNEIPYGSTNYGIQSASIAYFDKDIADITLAEAATLAAIPQRPTTLLNNPELLQERRNWILTGMEDLEYIDEEELALALAQETPVELSLTGIDAPHYVLWVKELLEEEYSERTVEQGGLKVTTSLDWEKQEFAEDAIANNYEARSESYGFNNSGLVAIDPNNGHILAMVGSADYFDDDIDGQVNVTLRPLQPGSSMKPIFYAAGFEAGYTPNSILWDVNTNFPTATGNYAPRNYDLDEKGPVTIRKALQGSLNIPAVKMLALVGVQNGLDFAERLHYSTFSDRSNFGLAIVLGGAEVELLDHVAAYGTFATEGIYHEPVAILKVEDSQGEVLFEWEEEKGERVMEENIARMISNVLSDNNARAYAFGTNSYLQIGSRPVAAKTGTTNDYKDGWTVGYTPQLVAGVWTGNTKGAAMHRGSGGSTVAAPIWNEFMRNALANEAVEYFNGPSIPITGKAMLDGQIPTETVVIDTASGKLATDQTPERFREEKSCGEYHTILTYVNTSNPTGDEPKNPENNYLYNSWEAAVQDFLVRHNESLEEGEVALEVCEIPTEEDDVHTKANQPKVTINSPDRGDDVGRSFDVDIRATAVRGISRVEYLIDGSIVLVDLDPNGTQLNLPTWVDAGTHMLSVVAYDDVDNSTGKDVSIDVTEAGGENSFSISNPFNNQEIQKSEEPYQIAIENTHADDVVSLIVSAINLWTGEYILIAEVVNPSVFEAIAWTLPNAAEYLLNAHTVMNDGAESDAAPIRVIVIELAGEAEPIDLVEGVTDEQEAEA
jgi:1A family penicillin-binding protein